jgi:hypothetical protein
MRTRRLVLTLVLPLAFAAVPQTASAQVAGEHEGVTAQQGARGYILRFDKRAARTYRRIAGRRIEVGCSTVVSRAGSFVTNSESGSSARAPRRRGRIRTFVRGPADFCSVRLAGPSRQLVAAAPVTDAGRTYLDELLTASSLMIVFEITGDDDAVPAPTATVVTAGRGLIVALDGPDATPPRGKVGYWTDGVRAVAAAVSRKGRRLFFETERDVVRTNVLGYLNDET